MYESKPSIDWQESVRLANNKLDLAEKIMAMYIESLPESKTKIFADHDDYEKLAMHLHKLSGASCYCGVPKIKEAISELETAIKQHKKKQIDILINTLSVYIDEVMEVYKKGTYR